VLRELPIAVKNGPSIHDYAITGRYALVFDLPVTFSMKAVVGGMKFSYRWNLEHGTRVCLLPRNGGPGDIVWCALDPCYVFHAANSFDRDDGKVVADLDVSMPRTWQPSRSHGCIFCTTSRRVFTVTG
jgi:carotenoid cleavage dioxygenase